VKPVVKIIDDIDVIKVAIEENRKQILLLLNKKDMTVSELADEMRKDISTIYRHVHKLEGNGLVEQAGERRVHHIPEKIYGRTARLFLYSSDAVKRMGAGFIEAHALPSSLVLLDILRAMGYEIDGSPEFAMDFTKMLLRFNVLATQELQGVSLETEKGISISTYMLVMLILAVINLDADPELKEMAGKFLKGVKAVE
jgi:DNA-binding transcriptional ArsR family regulator